MWVPPEMAKLALVPGWRAGPDLGLGVCGGEQDMGLPAPSFPALGQLWARKASRTIFSWSVPWQEGRAEKHGAGRGAGQGEGKAGSRGVRKGQGAGRQSKEKAWQTEVGP